MVRSPEIVHGLGNIIQNAAQFAEKNVNISTGWDEEHITVIIQDDGPGFPSGLVERLGEPYISSRTQPGGHMGLGIFIARTLLQRSGASITFQNSDVGGAVVEVFWRRETLEAQGKEALQ